METEQLYAEWKPMLTALAYRMLGSWMDAEDIVQEAFIAIKDVPEEHMRSGKSYLSKVVANRCIDKLRSASHRREAYVGPWLPEPVLSEGMARPEGDPLQEAIVKESISMAYLLLLQQLTPTERIVFLLREVFGYEYDEIADIAQKSPANCRQIFRRAKRSIGAAGAAVRPAAPTKKAAALVERFAEAVASGNMKLLLEVVSSDASLVIDGGGKVKAALRPLLGLERIGRFFLGIMPELPPDLTVDYGEINGAPGLRLISGGRLIGAAAFRFGSERIEHIYLVLNPEKLGAVRTSAAEQQR